MQYKVSDEQVEKYGMVKPGQLEKKLKMLAKQGKDKLEEFLNSKEYANHPEVNMTEDEIKLHNMYKIANINKMPKKKKKAPELFIRDGAERIIIYVFIGSTYNNSITIEDISNMDSIEEDMNDNPRMIYDKSIYDKDFIDFLENIEGLVKTDHTYSGKLTFKDFQRFSKSVMDGRYEHDKNFYDARLFSITVFTQHETFENLFDRIYTEDIFGFNRYTEYKDPVSKKYEPYTTEQIIKILEKYHLYDNEPYELTYTNFDNNYVIGDNNCLINLMINKYGSNPGSNKDKLSVKNMEKYFSGNTSISRLWEYCKEPKHRIPLTVLDVFGKVIFNYVPNFGKQKNRGRLIVMTFCGHVYPYTKRVTQKGIIDMEFTNGDVIFDSKKLYGEEEIDENVLNAKKEFCHEFTSNLSFKSEHQLCPKSLRYSRKVKKFLKPLDVNNILHKEVTHYTDEYSYKLHEYEVEFNHYGEDDLLITEIDMKKAFHTCMFKLMKSKTHIPVFSVKSIIKEYNDEDIHDSNIYFLKEESLEKLDKLGIYSNYHHGFVINHLLEEDYIKKSDIESYKPFCSLYHLSDYREKVEGIISKYHLSDEGESLKGVISKQIINEFYNGKSYKDMTKEERVERNKKIYELRKQHCSIKTFTDIFMLYNGICGMSYTNPKKTYVRIREEDLEKELEFLRIKNNDLTVSKVYDYENCVQISKTIPKKYKYLNNRNIYDYCISATNLYMLKAIKKFKNLNPNLPIVRINTDCITFVMKPTHKIVLDKYLNEFFKFKHVTQELAEKTTVSIDYIDPKKIKEGMLEELNKMKDSTTGYIGGPGTGKTYNVKSEDKHDFAITISNVCCRNMDTERVKADTMFHYFVKGSDKKRISLNERLRRFYNKTIWFDEFSMFDMEYFNYIFLLTQLKNAKIVITGDPNQIPPFHSESVDLKHPFFELLFSNTKLLDKNMRVNDDNDGKELFSYIEKVRNNLENYEFVEDIKKIQVECDNISDIKVHLAYNVRTKDMINNYIYDKNNHKFCRYGPIYVFVTKGLRLIVRTASKKFELYKSIIYEVIETRRYNFNEKIKLWNVTLGKEEEHNVKFLANMGLGFAITTHSSQGLTIREKCCIHQSDKMFELDPRIYYTAVTRATKMSDIIHVKGDFEYHDDKLKVLKELD